MKQIKLTPIAKKQMPMSVSAFSQRLGVSIPAVMGVLNRHPEIEKQIPVWNGNLRFMWSEWGERFRDLITHECAAQTAAAAARKEQPAGLREEEGELLLTYGDVRTKRELYTAKKAELDYNRAAGKLVSAAAVERLWSNIAVSVQRAVLTVPDRITPLLVGETDQTLIHSRITTELKYALKTLSFSLQEADVAEPEEQPTVLHPKERGRPKKT